MALLSNPPTLVPQCLGKTAHHLLEGIGPPPYSPDLSLWDFQVISPFKSARGLEIQAYLAYPLGLFLINTTFTHNNSPIGLHLNKPHELNTCFIAVKST